MLLCFESDWNGVSGRIFEEQDTAKLGGEVMVVCERRVGETDFLKCVYVELRNAHRYWVVNCKEDGLVETTNER